MKSVLFLAVLVTMVGCGKRVGPQGQAGQNGQSITGPQGNQGVAGTNGFSSLVSIVNSAPSCEAGGITVLSALDSNRNMVVDVSDTNLQSATICNGVAGNDAEEAEYLPVEIINPCGDARNIFDEVFIRLNNGTILASFSDNESGKNTRFSILVAGSYVSTDGDKCYFSVDARGNLFNEHH